MVHYQDLVTESQKLYYLGHRDVSTAQNFSMHPLPPDEGWWFLIPHDSNDSSHYR
jgi:hypothetical protein